MFKTYLHAISQSFYKPEIYRQAIYNWKGFGGRYLVLLGALLAVILYASFLVSLNVFEKQELPYIAEQVPTLTIVDGVVSVKEKQPLVIQSKNKQMKITINTAASENELRAEDTQFGLGKDFLFMKGRNGQYELIDLKKFKGKFSISKETLFQQWNDKILSVKIFSLPLLWLGQITDLLVHCLIVAVLSYAVTAFMAEEYIFLTRMRIAALALTPAEIISALLKSLFNHTSETWFIMLLACLYIYVMIVLMRRLPPVETVSNQAV
jgi:Protein of unknown function (DUF1189)